VVFAQGSFQAWFCFLCEDLRLGECSEKGSGGKNACCFEYVSWFHGYSLKFVLLSCFLILFGDTFLVARLVDAPL
jgi:hypothetical protein